MSNKIKLLSVVKKRDEEKTREIFKKVLENSEDSEAAGNLKVGQPSQIPNQLLFVVEIDNSKAVNIIKKLTYEGVAIVKNDPSIRAAVNEAIFELENQQANTIQRIKKEDELKNKFMRKKGDYTVEELLYLKDWELMVSVALNQSYKDIEKSRQIKQYLPEVINEAIEKEIESGSRSLGAAKSSIEKLTAIAENETLKRFHLLGSMKKAGDAIISLCSQHPKDLVGDLIFLTNCSTTISHVNVKAFITFYKFVSSDIENFEYEILVATRHINTRALDTIHRTSAKLSPEEKELFDAGIEFFKEKRKQVK